MDALLLIARLTLASVFAVVGWQRVYGDRLTLAVVSSGAPEANRAMTAEYGIPPGLVLLQSEHEVFETFALSQMPSAIVIGADGEIRHEAAYGAHPVRMLIADTLGLVLPETPVQQVQPAAIGEPGPVFRRPDVDGNPREVGGRENGATFLLFWNPGCPHCERLLPDVKAWEAQPGGPNFVVVSRGPVGLNRELGLRSPVVLDDDRTISMAYGATGTPAAVVIDSLGVIASGVGRGATGVRTLVAQHVAVTGAWG